MANKMAEKIKSSGGQVTLNTTVNKILTKKTEQLESSWSLEKKLARIM